MSNEAAVRPINERMAAYCERSPKRKQSAMSNLASVLLYVFRLAGKTTRLSAYRVFRRSIKSQRISQKWNWMEAAVAADFRDKSTRLFLSLHVVECC